MEKLQETATETFDLQERWDLLKKQDPSMRIRNAADALGVSELELLKLGLGNTVTKLSDDITQILSQFHTLGRVKTITRNDPAVHETVGAYKDLKIVHGGKVGLCLEELDLRFMLPEWRYAFSVKEDTAHGPRKSIQFFDPHGLAIHKAYAISETNDKAWEALVKEFTAVQQDFDFTASERPVKIYKNAGKTAAAKVRDEWLAIKDVHDFNPMLKRLGIHRMEALRLVGSDFARPLPINRVEQSIDSAVERKVPIMVFASNPGMVQIYTGQIEKIMRMGSWYNILDKDFNLHLNTARIKSVWLVRRPTDEGVITSIEAYGLNGDLILTLFGARKPGEPELEAWRDLVESLEAINAAA